MEEGGTKAVDLTDTESLKVSIADALNEQEIVKFTVQTKTTLEKFKGTDFTVTRTHDEFLWLHASIVADPKYAGFIIPPAPPKPDFSQSHGKLATLQAGDAEMPQEELAKLKSEIQSEYLAAFQKTVAMHEVFLIRLAFHANLRDDANLELFLVQEKPIEKKVETAGSMFMGLMGSMVKSVAAGVQGDVLAAHVEEEPFFDTNKDFILKYHRTIKEAVKAAEVKVRFRKLVVHTTSNHATQLTHLGNTQTAHYQMSDIMRKTGQATGTHGSVHKKLAAKEDLKMTDLLAYYSADTGAAKDLMTRRVKAFNEMQRTDKALAAAKLKGKKVIESQEAATQAKAAFEAITKTATEELNVFQKRRAAAFRKGLIQYTQCQIRQSRESYALWKQTLKAVHDM